MKIEEEFLQKQVVYQGKYLRTEEHTVQLPDGRKTKREIVVPPDAVGILALDQENNAHMVRQYRSAIRRVILEIPAGILEQGESIEDTARRECEEEIGMTPGHLKPLFSFFHSVGFSTGKIQVYLARELTPCSRAHHDSNEFLEIVILPFEEIYQKAIRGEIVDSKTLMAILWFSQFKNILSGSI